MNEAGPKKLVRENLDVAVDQCSTALDNLQVWSHAVLQKLQEKLNQLYSSGVSVLDTLDVNGKVEQLVYNVGDKYHSVIEAIRSHGINVQLSAYLAQLRYFLTHQVSTQAIYFGMAGLVTGSVIGLCIGYSVKRDSRDVFSTSFSSTLMRAILTTNTSRRIDGITVATTTVPNLVHPEDVLIHVKAMSVDSIDAKIACGYKNVYRNHLGLPSVREPFILGRECSGTIVDIGHSVRDFEINDKVWVCLPVWAARGVMSEYIVVPDKYIGHKPKNVTFEGAATLPYASIVLWRKVIIPAKLDSNSTKNKRVLINFGSVSKNDGVGLLATQVMKAWGARVTISMTEQAEDSFPTGHGVAQLTFLHSLKSLGAESHLILPLDKSLLPNVAQRIFDVVINTDCSELSPHLESFCKDPTKAQVFETFPPNFNCGSAGLLQSVMKMLFGKEKPYEEPSDFIFAECHRLVESGLVVPIVAKSFLVTQFDQAFRHVINDSTSSLAHVGKNVIVFKAS